MANNNLAENRLTASEMKEIKERKIAEYESQLDESLTMKYKFIPKSVKYLWLKCQLNKNGPKEKVKMKCLDCCCYMKDEITNCNIIDCGLYTIRPYQK